MTTFVLVPGPRCGSWVWEKVAARLRESGSEVHLTTLTGYGDRRHLAGPETDLATHVEDLVQLIDHVAAPELVMVGHCYSIHPVWGAADRRPERCARLVCVDGGMPQDGHSPVDGLPDELRERVRLRIEQAGDDWRLFQPSAEDRHTWGSVDGVPEEVLARLHRLAAPQPVRTLTQPLRLSGAAAKLPLTGVLCTRNGMNIGMVEAAVASGEPQFRMLTDPRVGFFELATGHWPMLSAPDELADVLLRAVAGEGHRVGC
ncbi:alpha/beta fold hydrolase [Streptomyces halobius]|uniref:Alpha/beta hydrolase n=1 Tax=Streptomyces halobius TaxID=2879846 RepID=A0ABY4M072_9ACTN|nr:alpha/beta hydrolase [Streptomyces halobius]UQA90842.1 alpha/beta hydrolase [Streptomyces halobius]